MKRKFKAGIRRLPHILVAIAAGTGLLMGCEDTASSSTESVQIVVSGRTTNPVNVAWTIHSDSGTVGSRVIAAGSPLLISGSVSSGAYGTIEATVSDSGSTGDNEVTPVGLTVIGETGSTSKTLTLNQSIETSPGVFLVAEGDYLEDAAGAMMYIGQDPTVGNQVQVLDSNDAFTIGACRLWTSNSSSLVLEIYRDGLYLGGTSGYTLEGAVSLSYGSLSW